MTLETAFRYATAMLRHSSKNLAARLAHIAVSRIKFFSVTLKSNPSHEEVIHCLLTLVRRGSPGAVKARW